MADDAFQRSLLSRAISDLFTDLSEFVQKEIRLARAELAHKISVSMYAGMWMAVAAVLAIAAALLVIEGIVFAIASAGLALHWSCLLVAVVMAAAAAGLFYYGRASVASEDLAPTRSVRQFSEAVSTAKEQLR
jgi:uncharacterized membrane protein YgcG